MRRAALIPLAASALLIAVAPVLSQPRPQPPGPPGQQRGPQQPPQPPAPPPQAPAKPYNPVAITPPKPIADPSFDAFRNQLTEIDASIIKLTGDRAARESSPDRFRCDVAVRRSDLRVILNAPLVM